MAQLNLTLGFYCIFINKCFEKSGKTSKKVLKNLNLFLQPMTKKFFSWTWTPELLDFPPKLTNFDWKKHKKNFQI